MMEPTSDYPQPIVQAEKLLADRFSGYAIVAMDGDKVYACYSSATVALGCSKYLDLVATEQLKRPVNE